MLGFGDKAIDFYKMINPIEHTRTREAVQKYKVEPYVIPADIYGAENLSGRGGWTWYTGSSSWYYLAGIQYILGLNINNNVLSINPCISKSWKEYSIRYRYKTSIYNIHVVNKNSNNTKVTKILVDGVEADNKIKLEDSGKIFNVEVEM